MFALGPSNLARVGAYRVGLRLGIHSVLKVHAKVPSGPFYRNHAPIRRGVVATSLWDHSAVLFSAHQFPLGPGRKPDWHVNPFLPGACADKTSHWSRIADFDASVGDIKAVWEASRFDWLIAMAQRASLGNSAELVRLNDWLQDWLQSNPPYFGANWKCGQEASIRVMHMALAAMVLGETHSPTTGLQALIRLHLARIAPTVGYAIGQQNNHGTSEAAALFIGGSWLAACGDVAGMSLMNRGRKWLEDRAATLIEPDGTFSQYSLIYHCLMLDTYGLVEAWRRHLKLPRFSDALVERLRAATLWLQQLTDPVTGDAPNLGANDGARLLPVTETTARDFRPSLQLAASLFHHKSAISEPGLWDQPTRWLGVSDPVEQLPVPQSASFDDGGLHVLRNGAAVAYLRYPRFRFRPSQADALHLDLWINGENLLRDAGTYSYFESVPDGRDFGGTAFHNTAQIGGREQMPRLGRFLYGSWLRSRDVRTVSFDGRSVSAAAAYVDRERAYHHRSVQLDQACLTCIDTLAGPEQRAVIRFRLKPGDWSIQGTCVHSNHFKIRISSDQKIERVNLVTSWESRAYLLKTLLPVVEVETGIPATVTTQISWQL